MSILPYILTHFETIGNYSHHDVIKVKMVRLPFVLSQLMFCMGFSVTVTIIASCENLH